MEKPCLNQAATTQAAAAAPQARCTGGASGGTRAAPHLLQRRRRAQRHARRRQQRRGALDVLAQLRLLHQHHYWGAVHAPARASAPTVTQSKSTCVCWFGLPAQRPRMRVRVEIMGSHKRRNVGKSQPVLIMINPMISARPHLRIIGAPAPPRRRRRARRPASPRARRWAASARPPCPGVAISSISRGKNRRGIGKSQAKWATAREMEAPRSPQPGAALRPARERGDAPRRARAAVLRQQLTEPAATQRSRRRGKLDRGGCHKRLL
jgi:hypothetical protein